VVMVVSVGVVLVVVLAVLVLVAVSDVSEALVVEVREQPLN
jgi:hypothetical protein